MAEKLTGKWKMTKIDNIEDYMKDAKFGFILRQILRKLTVDIEIIKNSDEEWQINYLTSFKDFKQKFKVNERFQKKTNDGRQVMATYSFEGNKLIYIEESLKEGEVPSRCTIQVTEDGLLHEAVATIPNNVVMDRWYTLITKY